MVWWLLACRPDPGDPVYPDRGDWEDTASPEFGGFTPYDPEVERLDFGVFYEGDSSEQVLVDGVANHFYVYSSTFSVEPSEDRIEGAVADRMVVGNVGWWGGGVHWAAPTDLSGFEALHIGLKTDDPAFAGLTMGVIGGDVEVRLPVANYGFQTDGEWHSVSIPLADLTAGGADMAAVTVPFIFIGEGEPQGASILFDDAYYTEVL